MYTKRLLIICQLYLKAPQGAFSLQSVKSSTYQYQAKLEENNVLGELAWMQIKNPNAESLLQVSFKEI